MADLYASIEGRGKATVTGSEKTGLTAHVRGWDSGIYIDAFVKSNGDPVFVVSTTGGSNNETDKQFVFSLIGGRLNLKEG